MRMRILVLDDDPTRHKVFDTLFAGHTLVHVYTVPQLEIQLARRTFNLICLDHDLGDQPGKPGNGQDAAYVVAAHFATTAKPFVLIHSWNTVGARAMVNILQEAGIPCRYRPFDQSWSRISPRAILQ